MFTGCANCNERAAAEARIGAIGSFRPGAFSPAHGQRRASPDPRSPDSPLNAALDRMFAPPPPPPPLPRAASPSPNAAFPGLFARRQSPQLELPMEAVIICKGSQTAAPPFVPFAIAKGSTWLAARTATSKSLELVSSPEAVAFLLTQELGVAHVSWKQSEGLLPMTSYTLRLE